MIGRYTNLFRSRWKAVWWAAGVIASACYGVSSSDPRGVASGMTVAPSSPPPSADNPWALDLPPR